MQESMNAMKMVHDSFQIGANQIKHILVVILHADIEGKSAAWS